MKKIIQINDLDIGEKIYKLKNPATRVAVRAILINEQGEIAILHKSKRNEYKLIGGGVEINETLEESLKREVLEESGCEIQIIEKLGFVEEIQTFNNFIQKSYIYVAKVLNDTKHLNFTEQEKIEGASLYWYFPDYALLQIKKNYENLISQKNEKNYSSRIIMKRDELILEYYLKQQK